MAALTRGTLEGLQLLLNIVAMLVVFVALVALVNALLGLLPAVGGDALTLERMFGWLFSPLAWLIGIPWAEVSTAGACWARRPCSTSSSPISIWRSCRLERCPSAAGF